jgi:hypothetical protein
MVEIVVAIFAIIVLLGVGLRSKLVFILCVSWVIFMYISGSFVVLIRVVLLFFFAHPLIIIKLKQS